MSVAKLLLSGFLVASGLIVGAFTLHARIAPRWEVHAYAAARPYGKPQSVDVLQEPDWIAASVVPDNWTPRLIKSDPKPSPVADAETAKAKKKLADKKLAEKRQTPEKVQQEYPTLFSWLADQWKK
jgi:hypothetical protein